MKFTLSWLKEHLDTKASLAEIDKTLTMIGLEVESIADRAASLAPFTVARILHAEKHPEADKLRVCKVQSDAGELQIVCGAPNARAGIFVALAKEGAVIPNGGMVIKKTKIRGVESCGMLCSRDELALPGDSEGIIELPEAAIGAPVADVLGLGDPVIEIAITPNRADCLGVRGIARDLAAAGLGHLHPLPLGEGRGEGCKKKSPHPNLLPEGEGTFLSPVSVSITTPHCGQFLGVYLRGVKNGPSPEWLRARLEAIGQKPISALVDISNYLTVDLGRPMHMYDAKKLRGNLVVRDAKDGEKLKALNNNDYTLKAGMCVIADDSGPVALAGIIGGAATGCDNATTEILLEVALFDPANVAAAGRALQIDTDARYRFERGVDPMGMEPGAQAALSLIQSLCGGTASKPAIAGKAPEWKRSIAFDPARVKTLGGVDISADKSYAILESLGFSVVRQPSSAVPPSWRADVEGEADLVEEVLRIAGYDHIPPTPLPKLPGIGRPALDTAQKRAHLARRLLASRGFLECRSWSFVPQAQAAAFGGGGEALRLINPISADLDTMRPCLLPGLLLAAARNRARGFADLALAEVGLQFSDAGEAGQRLVAAGIRTGTHRYYVHGEQFETSTPPLDAFDAKTDAMAALAALGVAKFDITADTPGWYHPGRSGALTLGGKIILGYFGEMHPGLLAGHDLAGPVVAFELFLDAVPQPRAKGKARPALKLSDYQAVGRDFAFIVDGNVTAAEIEKAIRAADKNLITDVAIFDVYAGKGVPEGKKSVAVQVTLQSFERTLAEPDIAAASSAIVAAAARFGGQLRQ